MINKIFSSVVLTALVSGAFVPVVFAADLEISGNGTSSTNAISTSNTCIVTVGQSNRTSADIDIKSTAISGENTANSNVGGEVSIDTGKSTSDVTVAVTGGSNEATLPSCCACDSSAQTQLVSGNGVTSANTIAVASTEVVAAEQVASTKLKKAKVKSKAVSGKNKAKKNTGSGVTVTTDTAESTVHATVDGGTNTLNP